MDFGYKVLLIGLIMSIAVFILPYEYPNIVTKEFERFYYSYVDVQAVQKLKKGLKYITKYCEVYLIIYKI